MDNTEPPRTAKLHTFAVSVGLSLRAIAVISCRPVIDTTMGVGVVPSSERPRETLRKEHSSARGSELLAEPSMMQSAKLASTVG